MDVAFDKGKVYNGIGSLFSSVQGREVKLVRSYQVSNIKSFDVF